ncbi:MAG TPA: SpoIID/LytB domain-containing protein [Phycisphaerales bacterium]|nr:SpoIID/LytB domain-containing protein [Phycisphaerales bacterium]
MRRLAPALLLLSAGALSGCETVSGVAKDLTPREEPVAPVAPISYPQEPDLRVRIAKGATKKTISGPARLVARQASTTGKSVLLKTPLTVTNTGAGVQIVDGNGGKHTWPHGSDVEIVASEGDPLAPVAGAQPIKVDTAKVPGFITIKGLWNDTSTHFDVVATMPIEAYLPGVVTHELLPKWPRQTNEAQAVASRTYALHERTRARAENRPVDVEITTVDQVYGAFATPVATEAVRATRGMILVGDGKLLRAYFSSQCGGRPASAADVWPDYPFNKARALQGQPRQAYCQKAPLYRWEVTRKDEDVNRRLRAWGRATKHDVENIARLRSIEVQDRNDADRPNRYKLTDDKGNTYVLKAEELRMGLNHTVSGLPPITRENRIHSGDLEAEVWANQVRFTGRGWGHGVGMCQWCAKGMADQGMDWSSMVRAFYPGVEVVKAY